MMESYQELIKISLALRNSQRLTAAPARARRDYLKFTILGGAEFLGLS
jgi:hypothetical protein